MKQVILRGKKIWTGGDLNGHVGEYSIGNKECMGKCGIGTSSDEGERIISFAKAENLANVNTYFKEEINKLITYSSTGIHSTTRIHSRASFIPLAL